MLVQFAGLRAAGAVVCAGPGLLGLEALAGEEVTLRSTILIGLAL